MNMHNIPRELAIVLNGPIGPQRLRDDTIVTHKDGWYRTLTPSAKTCPAANEILFSNLDPKNIDSQIDELIEEYHSQGLPLSWCVYPWTQPEDLGSRLTSRRATVSNIRAHLANTTLPLKVIPGVEVKRVTPTSTEEVQNYIKILSSGYNFPQDEEDFRLQRYSQLCAKPNPVMHLFIARCDGIVAGCTAIIIKDDSAHLTTASVLPEYQARGVFQSLIATSLSTLRDMGITLASGHSNKQSAFWTERFGFKFLYEYDIYDLNPPEQQ